MATTQRGRSHPTQVRATASGATEGDGGAPQQEAARAPASCTVTWINLVGAASLVGATLVLSRLNLPDITVVLITLLVPALTISLLENIFIQSRIPFCPTRSDGYVAAPSGLPASRRVVLKLIGLAASIGALAGVYWLFPIYRGGAAKDLLLVAERLLIPFFAFMPLYIWYVDKKSDAPEDGYFHLGLFLTGSGRLANREVFKQHCLQWLVKAFFLPLMLGIYARSVVWLAQHPIEKALGSFLSESSAANWLHLYNFLYNYLIMVDVGIACIGYLLTLKLLDSEVRSAEPTLLGWTVCLACYAPFWGLIGPQYLGYGRGNQWEALLAGWPAMKVIWSLLILSLLAIYVWATVQFGIRFSNLTHRGIVTNGPYRWLKHPAYLTKNASFWLMSLPFLAAGGIADGVRLSLLLIGVNAIYYMRAKTEESHLMIDPVYRQYVQFMRENDIFALLRRKLRRSAPERAARS